MSACASSVVVNASEKAASCRDSVNLGCSNAKQPLAIKIAEKSVEKSAQKSTVESTANSYGSKTASGDIADGEMSPGKIHPSEHSSAGTLSKDVAAENITAKPSAEPAGNSSINISSENFSEQTKNNEVNAMLNRSATLKLDTQLNSQLDNHVDNKGTSSVKDSTVKQTELDLDALIDRLKDTNAIGFFTKLTLKSDVEGLVTETQSKIRNNPSANLAPMKSKFDGIVLKTITLIEQDDEKLATDIYQAKESIWQSLLVYKL